MATQDKENERNDCLEPAVMEDETDINAKSIFREIKKWSKPSVEPVFAGFVDSEDYPMNFPKKGKCLIFNHKEFDQKIKLEPRNGADADAHSLYVRFLELGFDPQLETDLDKKKVRSKLKKAGKEDYSQYSCFVCCILSYGDSGHLYGRNGSYSTDHVFAPFRGDKCPTLLGKPKIFFIQACRKIELKSDSTNICRESTDAGDTLQSYKIPTHADFLIVYSTDSERNPVQVLCFIQALCAALKERAKDKDLMELLTIVNRKISNMPYNLSRYFVKKIVLDHCILLDKI